MTPDRSAPLVVDTMVISSQVNGHRQPSAASEQRELIAGRPVVVSFVTISEMRQGALKAQWGELRRRALERDLARFVVVQPDDELMRLAAELRANCEAAGHPLGQKVHEADRWIAATALRIGAELVSDDAVFAGVPSLAIRRR